MSSIKNFTVGLLLVAGASTHAEIIDFVDMTENGVYGESAWSMLTVTTGTFQVDITATKNGSAAYAYHGQVGSRFAACSGYNARSFDGSACESDPGVLFDSV